jgi:hypothetical protein
MAANFSSMLRGVSASACKRRLSVTAGKGNERDEDVRLDQMLILMKDRPDGEVPPLRFLNASSTGTSCR